MKGLILRGLARAGVVPVSRVEDAHARIRRLSGKYATCSARLTEVHAAADAWRRRHEEATAAVDEWKDIARRTKAEVEQGRAERDVWREQAKALALQLRELDARLGVIESAIRILDGR